MGIPAGSGWIYIDFSRSLARFLLRSMSHGFPSWISHVTWIDCDGLMDWTDGLIVTLIPLLKTKFLNQNIIKSSSFYDLKNYVVMTSFKLIKMKLF